MSPGRVVRILDRQTVIINLGRVDGVAAGDRFGIFTEADDIVDPTTGQSLGPLRLQKAAIEATRVHDRFTVCLASVRFQTPWHRSIAGLTGEAIRDPLPVNINELDPLPGGMEVHVGDPVERFADPQRRAVQEASKQPSPPELPSPSDD